MTAVDREAAIREIVASRGIDTLVHFTRASNLPSILEHGLLPIEDVLEAGLPVSVNDPARWDGWHDATCLSVSFPNSEMLGKCLRRAWPEPYALIGISPSVLWTHDCAFHPVNAASKLFRPFGWERLAQPDVLVEMFAPEILGVARGPDLGPSHATDVQAEVLVAGRIDPSLFDAVLFSGRSHGCESVLGGIRWTVENSGRGYFAPRHVALGPGGLLHAGQPDARAPRP